MNENDIEVPPEIKMYNHVRFTSNQTFQKHDFMHENDNAFYKEHKRKTWAHKFNIDEEKNREIITTLLTSQGDNSLDSVDMLLEEKISYRDLASLSHADLEYFGFSSIPQRDELVEFFSHLPNQDPTYENICNLPEAQEYNDNILNNASGHLDTMRSALALSNYKLNLLPPEDVIVGEKSFASRFVLEALSELKGVTDEIDKELDELGAIVTGMQKSSATQDGDKDDRTEIMLTYWILFSSLATGALAALWFWKLNKYFK